MLLLIRPFASKVKIIHDLYKLNITENIIYSIILPYYLVLKVSLQDGLQKTIEYFKEEIARKTFSNNQTYMDVKTRNAH